jgi:hypothetical protein
MAQERLSTDTEVRICSTRLAKILAADAGSSKM